MAALATSALAAGALPRLRARLRHPLQPEQRRQLRRGAGPRHVRRCWPLRGVGRGPRAPRPCPCVAGLLLGLAFWCHILAVIHVGGRRPLPARRRAAPAVPALVRLARRASPSATRRACLWNAANGWESFRYLLPGSAPWRTGERSRAASPAGAGRCCDDHAACCGLRPRLRAAVADLALRVAAIVGPARRRRGPPCAPERDLRRARAARWSSCWPSSTWWWPSTALPYIPGNPRYLLFLILPVAVLLARLRRERWGRPLLAALVMRGALGRWAQAPGTLRADAQWRRFVADLESAGVRWCYTDFYLATKVNFLSGERVVCSAKLGPTTTEYFFDYRDRGGRRARGRLIAVNATAAEKLERRLRAPGRDLRAPRPDEAGAAAAVQEGGSGGDLSRPRVPAAMSCTSYVLRPSAPARRRSRAGRPSGARGLLHRLAPGAAGGDQRREGGGHRRPRTPPPARPRRAPRGRSRPSPRAARPGARERSEIDPRTYSSWSLVASRQRKTSRSPRAASMSARAATTRSGDS